MNDDALIYSRYCEMQKLDADHFLQKYSNLIQWTDDAKILDIGCAEGTVSLETLLPKIPPNFQKFVLGDISPKLLNFAKKKIDDPRIDCLEMDIAGAIPANLQETFDHIFSFYCLQFIPEERMPRAMKNVFDLLKPGGKVLMSIIVTLPMYDMFKNMMTEEKWPSYNSRFRRIISLYHDCDNPDGKLRRVLDQAGLKVSVCKFEKMTYTYESWDKFLGFAFSVVPFSQISSEVDRNRLVEEFVGEMKQSSLIRIEDESGKVHMTYYSVVAFAEKPSVT